MAGRAALLGEGEAVRQVLGHPRRPRVPAPALALSVPRAEGLAGRISPHFLVNLFAGLCETASFPAKSYSKLCLHTRAHLVDLETSFKIHSVPLKSLKSAIQNFMAYH